MRFRYEVTVSPTFGKGMPARLSSSEALLRISGCFEASLPSKVPSSWRPSCRPSTTIPCEVICNPDILKIEEVVEYSTYMYDLVRIVSSCESTAIYYKVRIRYQTLLIFKNTTIKNISPTFFLSVA